VSCFCIIQQEEGGKNGKEGGREEETKETELEWRIIFV
jgi:hypothetical protein